MKIENDLIHEAATRELSVDEYKELLIILSNTSKDCLKDSISPTDLIQILSFMDFEDEYVSDLAERISKLIFPLFPIDFIQESSDILLSVFGVENYQLTLLIFNELTNVVKSFKSQGDVIVFTQEILKEIVDIIFIQYLELSCSAQTLLINYCNQSLDICMEIFQKIMKPKFKEISSNSVSFFRYIDVCVEIIAKSKQSEMFEIAMDDEVIGMINGIISNDDLLAHLNVLDVIKKMIQDACGYRFVMDVQILDTLYKRLPAIVDDPLNVILLPGYLSLFGELCRLYPVDALHQFGDFMSVLRHTFDSDNLALKFQSLEVFANFASDPKCKLCIANGYERIVSSALTALSELLDSSNPDNKCRSANALALIFTVSQQHPEFQSLYSVNLRWISGIDLSDKLVTFIRHSIALPIESMKMAGYNLAVAISNQKWGQQLICDHEDLVDFLVVRTDHWKSCIDLKFELIDNLVAGIRLNESVGSGRGICSDSVSSKLCLYHSEGKYFAPVHHDMMLVDTDV